MTYQKLTATIGDSAELPISMEWNGVVFEPADEWVLIFTAKNSADDADADAVFQKTSGAGIEVSGSVATISLVPDDSLELTSGARVFDIQAQRISDSKVRTVAVGEIYLMRDITRETSTSVPVITTETPLPFAVSVEWDDITGKPSTFTPTAHKSSHAIGGTDALTPGDIGAEVSGAAAAAQAHAIQRANHTGTQAANTISDLPAAIAATMTGVVVTKSNGTRTAYTPSANTDTARGVALEAAFAAAVAGDTIDLSPGNYYVAKSTSSIAGITGQFAILDRMTIRLNGARLYKKSTDTASAMFACNASNGIDDWSIIGPGTIEGSRLATADTAARGTAAGEIGIEVRASRRARIENVSVLNFAGTGIECNAATFASDEYQQSALVYKISTLHIHGCNIDLNNIGFANFAGNEYHILTNCTFNVNLTACDIYAGNTKFIGCDASLNTNFVLRIRNGGNDGHGSWVGGTISHNPGFAVAAEASMDNGFLFSGVHFYADTTTSNKIQSLGGGLIFTNCIIDSPFFASATPTGINMVLGCHMPIVIVSAASAVSDLSAAERARWKFKDNYTLTTAWASDDIRTTYADDAAAGAGGVLTGELWQQTTTGAVFVKL
jgi:hypothetical protein